MVRNVNKYHLKFAWLPKLLSNGDRIWFEHYYEVVFSMPIIHKSGMFYTRKRISKADYLIEALKGNIVDGVDRGWWAKTYKEIDEEFTRST